MRFIIYNKFNSFHLQLSPCSLIISDSQLTKTYSNQNRSCTYNRQRLIHKLPPTISTREPSKDAPSSTQSLHSRIIVDAIKRHFPNCALSLLPSAVAPRELPLSVRSLPETRRSLGGEESERVRPVFD